MIMGRHAIRDCAITNFGSRPDLRKQDDTDGALWQGPRGRIDDIVSPKVSSRFRANASLREPRSFFLGASGSFFLLLSKGVRRMERLD